MLAFHGGDWSEYSGMGVLSSCVSHLGLFTYMYLIPRLKLFHSEMVGQISARGAIILIE